ncbi:MAG: IS481 family transposase [Acidobacteriota bacterium]|nr:IS481 family transposase [Acidobacteriota bacterium]
MSHRNSRLTPLGRRLLVERVRHQGMPIAHVAKAMGVSRQCAHRWVARFDAEGVSGLEDRSSRPHRSPRRSDEATVARVLEARRLRREGPAPLSVALGVPARTISRILAREGVARIAECDPMTGEVIRSSRATTHRYERSRPGELVHVDVKKIGRIPEDGGWRVHGRRERPNAKRGLGYDYVHSMIDDHSRLAYSEILADERGSTCTGFMDRAITWFSSIGVEVESVITDNHMSYRRCRELGALLEALGIRHLFIKPYCPWQNGKAERFNRTLQIEWAYRQVFTRNEDRTSALAPWLQRYNYERPHSSLGGKPPISRVSPT